MPDLIRHPKLVEITGFPLSRLCHNVIARAWNGRSNLINYWINEIATLPTVARNDDNIIAAQPPKRESRNYNELWIFRKTGIFDRHGVYPAAVQRGFAQPVPAKAGGRNDGLLSSLIFNFFHLRIRLVRIELSGYGTKSLTFSREGIWVNSLYWWFFSWHTICCMIVAIFISKASLKVVASWVS